MPFSLIIASVAAGVFVLGLIVLLLTKDLDLEIVCVIAMVLSLIILIGGLCYWAGGAM